MSIYKKQIYAFGATAGLVGLLNLGISTFEALERNNVSKYQLAISSFLVLGGAYEMIKQNRKYSRLREIVDKKGCREEDLKIFIRHTPCGRSIARAILLEEGKYELYKELCKKYPLKRII